MDILVFSQFYYLNYFYINAKIKLNNSDVSHIDFLLDLLVILNFLPENLNIWLKIPDQINS